MFTPVAPRSAGGAQALNHLYMMEVLVVFATAQTLRNTGKKVKGKVFPYSLPSVGPGADPGVQAVSPQVT